jgi:hypothetical protein
VSNQSGFIPCKYLAAYPDRWSHAVEDEITRDLAQLHVSDCCYLWPYGQGRVFRTHLKKHDSGREQLLPDIELVLLDAYIDEEEVCQSVTAGFFVSLRQNNRLSLSLCCIHVSTVVLQCSKGEHEERHDDSVKSLEF